MSTPPTAYCFGYYSAIKTQVNCRAGFHLVVTGDPDKNYIFNQRQRDVLKTMSAFFDGEAKKWFVPAHHNPLMKQFLTEEKARVKKARKTPMKTVLTPPKQETNHKDIFLIGMVTFILSVIISVYFRKEVLDFILVITDLATLFFCVFLYTFKRKDCLERI